jgi:hypothetical protein
VIQEKRKTNRKQVLEKREEKEKDKSRIAWAKSRIMFKA